MSAALLIVAGLLTSSLARLLNVDKGFDTAQVVTVDIDPAGGPYEEAATRQRFYGPCSRTSAPSRPSRSRR